MSQDSSINTHKMIEGDINLSPSRKIWHAALDEKTKSLLEKDARYFMHQSLSTPCLDVLKSCQGATIENISGKKYLDFHGNNVHQIGYAHPKIIENVTKQIHELSFSVRRYTNEPAILFAEKLASLTPSNLDRVLLTPNGSSVIGIALKLARVVTGKHKVISFWDSFYGASMEAISVGGESFWRENMGMLVPGVIHIPPPISYRGIFENNEDKCLEYLEYVLSRDTEIGALLAETIRNTDVQITSKKFWQEARALCNKYGVLLILDEIPIALGRTGYMFAFEHYNIEPDILCLGKGLGGGVFPQAAMICRDDYNKFSELSLGHYTHEKSPLGAIAGLTTIQILEEEQLLEKVKENELFMQSVLTVMKINHPIIGDVRGMGLLWGIELVKDSSTKEKAVLEAEKIMYKCLKNGLSFKVSQGNVLQLSPALTINKEDLNKSLNILEQSITSVTTQNI